MHIAISHIANTLSKCEIKVFEKGEEVKNELYYKLNVSPNPNQNSSQFINNIIENYYYNGEALVINHNDNFYVCDSFAKEKEIFKSTKFTNLVVDTFSTNFDVSIDDCLYFKLDNKDIKKILTLVYAEYGKVLTASLSNYRKKNGRKYKLSMENYRAGDAEFLKTYEDYIQEQIKTFLENDDAVYPQFKGFNLEEFEQKNAGNTASNADIIAMRKDTFDIVAQAFKVPISMLMGNITNMSEIVKVYLTTCIDPLAKMMSEELTRKTVKLKDWEKGSKVKVDTSKINHVDIFEIGDSVDKLIASGTFSIDEARDKLGMETLNTEDSSKHFVTKNYEKLEGGRSSE